MKVKSIILICTCFLIVGCNLKKHPANEPETINYTLVSIYAHNNEECSQKTEEILKLEDITYYKVCIKEINVEYQDLKLYDTIKMALSESRINLKDITKLSKNNETEANCNIYYFDTFNLAINGKKIYFINKNLDFKEYCNSKED